MFLDSGRVGTMCIAEEGYCCNLAVGCVCHLEVVRRAWYPAHNWFGSVDGCDGSGAEMVVTVFRDL